MATIAKTKYLGPGPALRRNQEKAQRRAANRPDYVGLAVVILLMAAIMALAIWLASLGGGAVQPVDHWIMMP